MRVRNGHWIALCALLALTGAFLLHQTRDTTFWFDEWDWVLHRRGSDAATFLDPHNGHLSLVPVALYKLLFATVGLTDYAPYRALVIAAHLCTVALVFAYARRRAGDAFAALAAVLILLLGPAWQNILWPFQIGSVTSLAAGIGALLALDRGDRRGDVVASLLVALSLASSGLGVVMAIGIAVELLWARRRPRDLWIVLAPAVPFALWWLIYQDTDFVRHNLVLAPGFAADTAAGTMAALSGLSGDTTSDNGSTLAWGRPLAAVAAVLLAWRLLSLRPLPPRVVTLLALLGSSWLLTAVQRAHQASPDSSRYLYAGGVLSVLLAAELARGVAFPRRTLVAAAVVVGLACLANVGDLRDASRLLREQAAIARADLAALELTRDIQPPGYAATSFPGTPFISMETATYVDATRQLGSPALPIEQLPAAPEPARAVADAELVSAGAVTLAAAGPAQAGSAPPAVDAAVAGTAAPDGGCVTFRPEPVPAAGETPELQLTVPASGLRIHTGDGAATVTMRRFAAGFPATPLGRVAPTANASLQIAGDRAAAPWHVRVAPDAAVTACAGS